VIVPWNDAGAVEEALSGRAVAALIAEPYPANMGLVPPEPGFLEHLRSATTAAGTLLIFDEVISGFRVARGGAQEREGVTPDLTVLGKVIGGGVPAAAYAGSRELMERVAPAGDVYQAGTLSGNPLATAAGLATLNLLDAAAYARLDDVAGRLAAGLTDLARAAGVPAYVTAAPGLLTVFFNDGGRPDSYADAQACDADRFAVFWRAMLARGIYLPPSQFEAWFPSLAHTDEHLARTLAAAGEAFAEVRG
jgi:glutamate-1-semialdehyde 2,1-aminomutase